MPDQERSEYEDKIRQLLTSVRNGNRSAFDSLIEAVGHELRKLSAFRLRRQPHAHTLQTTALVNEVVIRLIQMMNRSGSKFPESRGHLLALTSHLMRCTLADYARKRRLPTVSLDSGETPLSAWSKEDLTTLLTLDEVLTDIELSGGENGKRRSEAVELFLFGGMSYREIADKLEISDDAARRDCQIGMARVREAFAGESAGSF